MKAIFIPAVPANRGSALHRLTRALSTLPGESVGTLGTLVERTDAQAAKAQGHTVLDGVSLAAIASAHGIASAKVALIVPNWKIVAVMKVTNLPTFTPAKSVYEAVRGIIAAIPDVQTRAVLTESVDKRDYERTSPSVLAFVLALRQMDAGVTDAWVDAIFEAAAAMPDHPTI